MKAWVEVERVKELRRGLKLVENGLRDLRQLNKRAAAVAEPEVRRRVRSRSGRLAGSVRATGSQSAGEIRAGSARVVYAGVQNYGNPTKKGRLGVIRPQQFMQDGVLAARPDVVNVYMDGVGDLVRKADLDS